MEVAHTHSGCNPGGCTPGSCHDIGAVAYAGHLAKCAHCKKRERQLPADAKLKRCAGCSIIMYCSKECQKAAWPHHKYSCRRPQDGPNGSGGLAGYDTPIALGQAVTDWADDTHGAALTIIANAMVGARGGIAANRSSRILLFELTPGNPDADDPGNPAEAFRLAHLSIVHKDEVSQMISSWDHITAERARRKEWFRRKMSPGETVLDVMPAVSRILGTNCVSTHYYPILALRCGTTAALPDCVCMVFEDVVEMCMITMNAGLALRRGECAGCGHCPPEPIMGKMVKRKKKWEWKKDESWAWNHSVRMRGGIDPQLLWQAFYVF